MPPPSIAHPFSTTASSSPARSLIADVPDSCSDAGRGERCRPRQRELARRHVDASANASASPPIAISTPATIWGAAAASGSSAAPIEATYSGRTPNSTAASPTGLTARPSRRGRTRARREQREHGRQVHSVRSGRRRAAVIASSTSPAAAKRCPPRAAAGVLQADLDGRPMLDQIRTSSEPTGPDAPRLTPATLPMGASGRFTRRTSSRPRRCRSRTHGPRFRRSGAGAHVRRRSGAGGDGAGRARQLVAGVIGAACSTAPPRPHLSFLARGTEQHAEEVSRMVNALFGADDQRRRGDQDRRRPTRSPDDRDRLVRGGQDVPTCRGG